MEQSNPMERLKKALKKSYNEIEDKGEEALDEFFPYVFRQPGDPPQWQRATIKYMPYRPYLIGMSIWIQVGDNINAEAFNIDTGEMVGVEECFVTNLNGPDEEKDVIAFYRNQIERDSGPDDFSWDDVDRVKYVDWDEGVVELTVEQQEEVMEHIRVLEEETAESRRVYAEWLQRKAELQGLGLVDETGRNLLR